ncbi:MAG: DoxX family protein [Allomuricauda sp.]
MKNNTLVHLGLAILRIVPSIFLMTHGYTKLIWLLNGTAEENFKFSFLGIGQAPSLFLAVLGEFVCPLLMIIGFKTRWAAIPSAITMFVAAFVVHANDPFGVKEHALLFLTFFVIIFLLGPGKYSVDKN